MAVMRGLGVALVALVATIAAAQAPETAPLSGDAWARVHAPEFAQWQRDYNSQLRQSFRALVFSSIAAPAGIELATAEPPGRRGIQSTGVFALPLPLAEDGVLTRDTLAITFYELGVAWNYQSTAMAADCEYAARVDPSLSCADYRIAWLTPPVPITPLPDDRLMLGQRRNALARALAGLHDLQQLLAGVVTVTALGKRADLAADLRDYDTRHQQCLTGSLGNACERRATDFKYPFDWLTAQVDAALLSPAWLRRLHDLETGVQGSISAAEESAAFFRRTHSGR
jgi:hypothetical protein